MSKCSSLCCYVVIIQLSKKRALQEIYSKPKLMCSKSRPKNDDSKLTPTKQLFTKKRTLEINAEMVFPDGPEKSKTLDQPLIQNSIETNKNKDQAPIKLLYPMLKTNKTKS